MSWNWEKEIYAWYLIKNDKYALNSTISQENVSFIPISQTWLPGILASILLFWRTRQNSKKRGWHCMLLWQGHTYLGFWSKNLKKACLKVLGRDGDIILSAILKKEDGRVWRWSVRVWIDSSCMLFWIWYGISYFHKIRGIFWLANY